MVQFKNAIVSHTLDGEKYDFKIPKKREKKEVVEAISDDDMV